MRRGAVAPAAALLLLAGCATPSSVILLPGAEGHATGKLAVLDQSGADEAVLADGNARVPLRARVSQKDVKPTAARPEEQALLDALPEKEAKFVLYFLNDSTDIAPRSLDTLDRMQAEVRRRGAAVDVEIVGYTDGAGDPAYNQGLSEERARQVRERLVADGRVGADYTHASGRGELDPLVPNPADGHAPDNRRVEVIVR